MPELACHRRERSRRSAARTLVRVARAAELLQSHHSAQRFPAVDMAPRRGREFWLCHGQDIRDKSKRCGYMVPTGTTSCDVCGHMPPEKVSCPTKAVAAVGDHSQGRPGGGQRGCGFGLAASVSPGTVQLRAQLAASQARERKLSEALAVAQAAASASMASPLSCAGGGMDVEDGAGNGQDAAGKAEVKAAREHVKALRALPPASRELPAVAAELAEQDRRLQDALAVLREAKPLDARLASCEAHVGKMEKLEATARKKVADAQVRQAELEKQIEDLLAAQADAEAKAAAAREELACIKVQLASNLSAEAGVHAADPAGCVVPPGCVSIKHAEAVLAEQLALRDAALAEAIAKVESSSEEPDDDAASVAGNGHGSAAEERMQRARKLRANGAKATLAHVRSHTFAKPRWGSYG